MKWGWVIGLMLASPAYSQFYFYDDRYFDQPLIMEAGLHLGMMNCLTDLGKSGEDGNVFHAIDIGSFRPEAGAFFSARWKERYGVRFNLHYGKVTAADSVLAGETGKAQYRYQRNLHFRSNIFEASVQGMLMPTTFLSPGKTHALLPFVAAGVGLFHFNPKAFLEQEWVALAPLRTEGNGPAAFYNLWQVDMPVTIGLRYEPTALFACYVEFEHRFLSTDYLDDVSTYFIDPSMSMATSEIRGRLNALYMLSEARAGPPVSQPGSIRGNPTKNDSFFSIRMGLAIVLNREKIRK